MKFTIKKGTGNLLRLPSGTEITVTKGETVEVGKKDAPALKALPDIFEPAETGKSKKPASDAGERRRRKVAGELRRSQDPKEV